MTRSRILGVVGPLALLLAAGVRPAIQPSARAAAPLIPELGIAGAEGTPLEPVVTLTLRVTGKRAGGGAQITIKGRFRGRAVAGRRTYALRPIGRAIATHRHGTAPAQRARIDRVFVDVRSDGEYLRVVGTGPLIGGPEIIRPGGVCRRVTFRYTARPKQRTATLRWACRRAGADHAAPLHLDVLAPPRDTIVSAYSILRQPCSPVPKPPAGRAAAPGAC